jgi:hypothetical protein
VSSVFKQWPLESDNFDRNVWTDDESCLFRSLALKYDESLHAALWGKIRAVYECESVKGEYLLYSTFQTFHW